MNAWLEAGGVTVLALAGSVIGYFFSTLRKPWWFIGYFLPLAMIILYALAIHYPAWGLYPPASWMMAGRRKFALIGFMATMVLTTSLSRLPRLRERVDVGLLMTAIAFLMSVWPFLAPVFNRKQLAQLQTRVDGNGVCRQSTDYTCGPAAAVTLLRKLSLPAEEGRIAIISHSSGATGTPPDILASALQEEYRKDGLISEFRVFKDVSELRQLAPALAVIKFSLFVDHYVAVFEVTDSEVIIGDPLLGMNRLSLKDFQGEWRSSGIVLKRRPSN